MNNPVVSFGADSVPIEWLHAVVAVARSAAILPWRTRPTVACVDELIERARVIAGRPGRRILGVAGAPGSGKSTFAESLVASLGPAVAVLVPMDGFHLAESMLEHLGSRTRKGAPDTFDVSGYANVLTRIREHTSHTIYAPRFDRTLEEPIAGSIAVPIDIPLVVTEGNYLLLDSGDWPNARATMDEVWYLDLNDDIRRERLVRRHSSFGKSDHDAHAWAHGSDEANAAVVAATASRADLRVSASHASWNP